MYNVETEKQQVEATVGVIDMFIHTNPRTLYNVNPFRLSPHFYSFDPCKVHHKYHVRCRKIMPSNILCECVLGRYHIFSEKDGIIKFCFSNKFFECTNAPMALILFFSNNSVGKTVLNKTVAEANVYVNKLSAFLFDFSTSAIHTTPSGEHCSKHAKLRLFLPNDICVIHNNNSKVYHFIYNKLSSVYVYLFSVKCT